MELHDLATSETPNRWCAVLELYATQELDEWWDELQKLIDGGFLERKSLGDDASVIRITTEARRALIIVTADWPPALMPLVQSKRDQRIRQCEFGSYPWDDWKAKALDAGVSEDLAGLGRDTMREAYNHNWSPKLQSECGWDDDGAAMIRFALEHPTQAEAKWSFLMQTDGGKSEQESAENDPVEWN